MSIISKAVFIAVFFMSAACAIQESQGHLLKDVNHTVEQFDLVATCLSSHIANISISDSYSQVYFNGTMISEEYETYIPASVYKTLKLHEGRSKSLNKCLRKAGVEFSTYMEPHDSYAMWGGSEDYSDIVEFYHYFNDTPPSEEEYNEMLAMLNDPDF